MVAAVTMEEEEVVKEEVEAEVNEREATRVAAVEAEEVEVAVKEEEVE